MFNGTVQEIGDFDVEHSGDNIFIVKAPYLLTNLGTANLTLKITLEWA